MGSVSSAVFGLSGNNALWIVLNWSESISGSTNKVTFTAYACTRYRINGYWNCRFKIDGVDYGAPRLPIIHGTGGSSQIGQEVISFTYTGTRAINAWIAIENMDYYDVGQGQSSTGVYYPNLDATINLSSTNTAPPTPVISCRNSVVGSNYLAENTLNAELSAVSDPDGDAVTYIIYGQYNRPGVGWTTIGDGNSCILYQTGVRNVSVDITGYPRGTQFRIWGRAQDSNGASSGSTGTISNIYRNRAPNPVKEIKPKEGYFNGNNFQISWENPGDPNSNTPTFNLWRSINGGDYVQVLSNSRELTYTQDISSHAEGTKYKFKILTYDGLTESSPTYSANYVKNTKPTKPSQIFPCDGFSLGATVLSWNKSTDPELRGIDHYNIYINNTFLGTSKETSYIWTIPDADPSEKEYMVSVSATDIDGKTGDTGYATGPFKKAKPPVPPSWIKPNVDFLEDKVVLEWEAVSSNGVKAVYQVDYRDNDGAWKNLITGLKSTKYTHDVTGITRGHKIQYRIKCTNSFGQASDFKESKLYYRNRIPLTPTITYPIENSTVYDFSPRIAFNIKKELDGQGQVMYVKCGGTTYNSVSNKNMFSKKAGAYPEEEKIVFTCPILAVGTNTITVYVNDGLINGPETSRTFAIKDGGIAAKKDETITAALCIKIKEQINSIRLAYGLSDYKFDSGLLKNKLIKFSYIEEMRIAIQEARSVLDNYDSSNPDKLTKAWISSGKNNIEYASIFQEIIDVIKNT